MANHKQHITFSSVSGLVFCGLAWYPCGFPAVTCLLAGGLCSVGGMLPDIDIKTSRSFQDCMSITACIASMLVIIRVSTMGASAEMISIIGATVFLAIKFGIGGIVQSFTVHRGLIHSIPFCILCGEIVFLVTAGDMPSRVLKAAGLALGFFSHLLLDEIYSVKVAQGKLSTKKSLGTALKFGQRKNMHLTVMLYFVFAAATYISFNRPAIVGEALDGALDRIAGLTIRGTQHFEAASSKAQQQLRENSRFQRHPIYKPISENADDSENTLLAQTNNAQEGTSVEPNIEANDEASQRRSRRYQMPPTISIPSQNVTPPAFSNSSPLIASRSLGAVEVSGNVAQHRFERPLLLSEAPQYDRPVNTQTVSPTATVPHMRPLLLSEIQPASPPLSLNPPMAAGISNLPSTIYNPVTSPVNPVTPAIRMSRPGAASLLPPASPLQ